MTERAPDEIERLARHRLLDEHASMLAAIRSAARDVADGWADGTTVSRTEAVDALEAELARQSILPELPAVLRDVGTEVGLPPSAPPVAAPPYVIVTGTGVTLRLPSADRRLVITLESFRIERDPIRYRFVEADLPDCLTVSVRRSP